MGNLVDLYKPSLNAKDITVGMKLRIVESKFEDLESEYHPKEGDVITVTDLNQGTDGSCVGDHCDVCSCGYIAFLFTVDGQDDEGEYVACYATYETLEGRKIV